MATILFSQPQLSTGPFNARVFGPWTVPVGINTLAVSTNISAADLADTTKSLRVEMQDGNGNTQAVMNWQGGQINGKTGQVSTVSPAQNFDVSNLQGQGIQAVVDIPNAVNMGFTITAE